MSVLDTVTLNVFTDFQPLSIAKINLFFVNQGFTDKSVSKLHANCLVSNREGLVCKLWD